MDKTEQKYLGKKPRIRNHKEMTLLAMHFRNSSLEAADELEKPCKKFSESLKNVDPNILNAHLPTSCRCDVAERLRISMGVE